MTSAISQDADTSVVTLNDTSTSASSPQEGEFALLVEGAYKSYRNGSAVREVVKDISIYVRPGTIHGLLGPNGAGKTTTIKMLLGLVRPQAGRFEILGYEAAPEVRRYAGFLPEQPYFSPHLTAHQVLRVIGRTLKMPKAQLEAQADKLLSKVGLEHRGKDRLSSYSRGMLQRFGIAQALLGDPKVLILDEPASGLDPVGQRDVRDLIKGLRDEGITVLLSSHQLSEVEAVCDEVTIVNRGRVAAKGDIEDLLKVAGQVLVTAEGDASHLPERVAAIAADIGNDGSRWLISIPEGSTRAIVDALDDGGFRVISLVPRRESLEEYFSRLIAGSNGVS